MIPYSKQSINNIDLKYVKDALKSKFLTQGPLTVKFEKKIAKYTNSRHAITFNSASSALMLACKVLNLKKNDIAWNVPNTYAATANAILHSGLQLDFVDIDPDSYNICIQKLKKKLILAKKKGKLPKLIIPIHFAGLPCDLKTISKLSKKYKFKIIEDASHALGAKYNNEKIGSCKYSEMCIFSFHPVKTITTGEGGAITTNNLNYVKLLRAYRSGGIIKNKKDLTKKSEPGWYYEQHYLGYNLRLNEIQAALGISQLNRIDRFYHLRKKISNRYDKYLKNFPLLLPLKKLNLKSAYHLYVVRLNGGAVKRNQLYNKLKKEKIETNLHYIPLHFHPFYKKDKHKFKNLEGSKLYYKTALSLPIYPDLKKKDQIIVIKKIQKYFS